MEPAKAQRTRHCFGSLKGRRMYGRKSEEYKYRSLGETEYWRNGVVEKCSSGIKWEKRF
jgi:hypothetical protein